MIQVKIKNIIISNRGFGILEVIIASLLMTIALVGIAELYVAHLNVLEVDRSQYVLNYAASSQLERLVCQVKTADEDPCNGAIGTGDGQCSVYDIESADYLPAVCPGCSVSWVATRAGNNWTLEVVAGDGVYNAYSSVEIVDGL